MKKEKKPTISIRKGSFTEELWLNSNGEWDDYKNRKRFPNPNGTAHLDAEKFARKHLSEKDFNSYSLFSNS